jgi:hypothetical protein
VSNENRQRRVSRQTDFRLSYQYVIDMRMHLLICDVVIYPL